MTPPKPAPLPERVDLLIVGAGTAGAACAWHGAEQGLSTLSLDAGPLERAGARWVNGVSARLFEEAGIPPPTGEELRGENHPLHMCVGTSRDTISVRGHHHLEVDMRQLVARLQAGAEERGATLVGDTRVEQVDDGQVHTDRGTVAAGVVVDASGMTGINLLRSPPVAAHHICAAAQVVHKVSDRDRALAFLAEHGAGMTAARMLVDAVAHGGGPEAYNVNWQRTHGGLFAAYDAFRRLSQRLTLEELRTVFRAGVLDARGVAAGLTQQFPETDPALLLHIGPAVLKAGAVGRKLAKTGAQMGLLAALYAGYPTGSRRRWARRAAKVAGDEAWSR